MTQPIKPEQEAPTDPISALLVGANVAHELFETYMTAGFTEPQAMQLVTAMVVQSVRGAS